MIEIFIIRLLVQMKHSLLFMENVLDIPASLEGEKVERRKR